MAAAAAPALISAARGGASEVAGVVKTIIAALEKPIYSDVTTTTVTHVTKKGDVVVTTKVKGWTIPLGLPVLVVGGIALWEIGMAAAQALQKVENTVTGAIDQLNPANWFGWIKDDVTGSLKPAPSGTTPSVTLPPGFMAHLSFVGQQALTPLSMGMNNLVGKLANVAAGQAP